MPCLPRGSASCERTQKLNKQCFPTLKHNCVRNDRHLVKWSRLIASKINISVYILYVYYMCLCIMYINMHTYSIYFENMYMYCLSIYIIYIHKHCLHFLNKSFVIICWDDYVHFNCRTCLLILSTIPSKWLIKFTLPCLEWNHWYSSTLISFINKGLWF